MTEKDNANFIERFTIRMPDGMRDAIAEMAKSNGRSMNSEIVQILQEALDIKEIEENDLGGSPSEDMSPEAKKLFLKNLNEARALLMSAMRIVEKEDKKPT